VTYKNRSDERSAVTMQPSAGAGITRDCCSKCPQHITAIQLGDPDIAAGTPQGQEVRDTPDILVRRRSRQAALADTATVESLDQLFFVVRMTQSDPAAWSDHAQRRQMR
jgi:hypothetical protein